MKGSAVSDDTSTSGNHVGLIEFGLKILGLALLVPVTFQFGLTVGLAAVGAACLAAAYLP